MKKLCALLVVSVTSCLIADVHILLPSLEYGSATSEIADPYVSLDLDFDGFGVGLRYMYFADSGPYLGALLNSVNGEGDACITYDESLRTLVAPGCVDLESSGSTFGGEIGMQLERLTPFLGVSLVRSEVTIQNSWIEGESDDSWEFHAGTFVYLDDVMLQATVYGLANEESRTLSGGILYMFPNDFVLGIELGTPLDPDVDGLVLSLGVGMRF
ncbi:MAG: hypothetical protein F4X44_08365 [Gammaproteobacteria bacterium]|nr:hypothetical protein [Gammaproteobacteria bacterium]